MSNLFYQNLKPPTDSLDFILLPIIIPHFDFILLPTTANRLFFSGHKPSKIKESPSKIGYFYGNGLFSALFGRRSSSGENKGYFRRLPPNIGPFSAV
jgi:hypothetical protein